ncbi:hypothetical protein COU75_00060 [Candidatus Peregrinibacteria bacterium CG10_big_fil_rev_8_21_14_0_10_42_8]|nr:MAG: hypothetical protein COU75_00060 [Candidatus Peregrinibacteria bacterium CG10_big_fil_rev_8_21_14_0_10_42_8]
MEHISLWMIIGFLLAAYSVIGNDSIQTLGTFIASNKNTKWYYLWLFTSAILTLVIVQSYIANGGDIATGRLAKIPLIEIKWYHAMAPLGLVILTRKGIPVSTSLLVLSAFASSLVFEKILMKSAIGYGLAAVVAYILWILVYKWDNKNNPLPQSHESYWRVLQWSATGFLWYTWLSHDVANIAVFLPRQLDLPLLLFVLTSFIIGLAYIFKIRGGKIQNIVLEKSHTSYIRSATIIDFCYAVILLVFKEWSSIPMSTTWVFIGLLSGRELAISTMMGKEYTFQEVFPIVGKDIFRLLVGLGVSVLIAMLIQHADVIVAFLKIV